MLVFIDGAEGATGLRLEERLLKTKGVELIKPEKEQRKDLETRRKYINRAEVVFLCLPDAAAREAVSLVENPETVLIDASTAHRTEKGWAYGFPELSREHFEAVKTSNRITVPGCHATGFCALVYPLVKGGIVKPGITVYCNSLTGYSGGGKSMIQDYESGAVTTAARAYALRLDHKHLPEMTRICGLERPPVFLPVIVNTLRGMVVSVPIARNALYISDYLTMYYAGAENISVIPCGEHDTLDIECPQETDRMEIFVFGNNTQTIISARFDNLGKGSAGAALQCMKLRKGLR